jgi:hypothetical protein
MACEQLKATREELARASDERYQLDRAVRQLQIQDEQQRALLLDTRQKLQKANHAVMEAQKLTRLEVRHVFVVVAAACTRGRLQSRRAVHARAECGYACISLDHARRLLLWCVQYVATKDFKQNIAKLLREVLQQQSTSPRSQDGVSSDDGDAAGAAVPRAGDSHGAPSSATTPGAGSGAGTGAGAGTSTGGAGSRPAARAKSPASRPASAAAAASGGGGAPAKRDSSVSRRTGR